jgi:hypothetical protein
VKKEKEVSLLFRIKVVRITKILHLLFVDDVLILTRACVAEWKVIVGLLKTFLHASGLEINVEKSTFHVVGVEEWGLAPFKEFFPFNYVPIEYSFRYLGYFLKTNCYKAEVWHWLIKKFERRIDHWCNRWLSLGGRLVLIKVVLEIQPVYWMSLATVPNSVLVKLCHLIFSFLWLGCSERKQSHLCNWETIARPKKVGGWGLRNISLFNKSLAAKTLWRGLTKAGIWHKVLKDKYLPFVSVSTWFSGNLAQSP